VLPDQQVVSDDILTHAKDSFEKILSDPCITDFAVREAKRIEVVERNPPNVSILFDLPRGVSFEIGGGVIQCHHASAWFVRHEDEQSIGFRVSNDIRLPPWKEVTRREAEGTATSFVRRRFPQFWELPGEERLVHQKEVGEKGTWDFQWERVYRGLILAVIRVAIGVEDGKVVGTCYSLYEGPLKLLDKVRVTPEEARDKFLLRAREAWGEEVARIELTRLSLLLFGRPPRPFYVASLELTLSKERTLARARDFLNAVTGEFADPKIRWARDDTPTPDPTLITEDCLPTWTAQGLLFASRRSLQGMPSWAVFPSQLFLRTDDGHIWYLTADCQQGIESVSGHPTTSRCLIQRTGLNARGWAYSLDLLTGEFDIHGTSTRHSNEGDISWNGSAVVVSAHRQGWHEDHVVLDSVDFTEPGMLLQPRITDLARNETQPIFSCDGKRVYFVVQEEKGAPAEPVYALYEAPAEKWSKGATELARIAGGFPMVMRMTMFPDGNRLLMWHLGGLEVVDLAGKERRPVLLPSVLDEGFPGGTVLETRDFAAGPGNDEITFSGLRWSGKEGDRRGWYIYVCRLDGSKLRRLTPLENEPVPAYVFPGSKQSALDLAKKLALQEIEFERTLSTRGG